MFPAEVRRSAPQVPQVIVQMNKNLILLNYTLHENRGIVVAKNGRRIKRENCDINVVMWYSRIQSRHHTCPINVISLFLFLQPKVVHVTCTILTLGKLSSLLHVDRVWYPVLYLI